MPPDGRVRFTGFSHGFLGQLRDTKANVKKGKAGKNVSLQMYLPASPSMAALKEDAHSVPANEKGTSKEKRASVAATLSWFGAYVMHVEVFRLPVAPPIHLLSQYDPPHSPPSNLHHRPLTRVGFSSNPPDKPSPPFSLFLFLCRFCRPKPKRAPPAAKPVPITVVKRPVLLAPQGIQAPLIINPKSPEGILAATAGFQYLHTQQTQDDANMLLLAHDGKEMEGKFLIRQADPFGGNLHGNYTLGVISGGRPIHHTLTTTDDGTFAVNGAPTPCTTLVEVVDFLGQHQKSIRWGTPLVHGVPSATAAFDPDRLADLASHANPSFIPPEHFQETEATIGAGVHPSQVDGDEGGDAAVPQWREEQLQAQREETAGDHGGETRGDQRFREKEAELAAKRLEIEAKLAALMADDVEVDEQKTCTQQTSAGPCTNNAIVDEDRCPDHTCEHPGCTASKSSKVSFCKEHANSKQKRGELFDQMDFDGDGKIDIDEAMIFGMDEATYKSLDVNSDGNLSKKEISKWLKTKLVGLDEEAAALRFAAAEDAAAPPASEDPAAFANEPGVYTPDLFPYMHFGLAKAEANDLLLADGGAKVTGKYLIRQIEPNGANEAGRYTLSVIYKTKATHHALDRGDDGIFLIGDRSTNCTTFESVVEYLAKKQKAVRWPVPLVQGVPNN
jgi:hypothetical protein